MRHNTLVDHCRGVNKHSTATEDAMCQTGRDRQRNATYGATVNVLGFEEDGEWCALALEMELRGYGSAFNEALKDLEESAALQVRFAHFKGAKDMIWHPAEDKYFKLYEQVRQERLGTLAAMEVSSASVFAIASMLLPPVEEIMVQKDAFLAYD